MLALRLALKEQSLPTVEAALCVPARADRNVLQIFV